MAVRCHPGPRTSTCCWKGERLQAARDSSCQFGRVIESTELLQAAVGGSASTKLLRVDLGEARPVGNCGRYYAGDRIAVYGENCPELVASIAAGLGLDAHSLDDMFIMQKIQTSSGGSSGGISSRFPLPSSFRTILGSYAGLSEQLQFAALAVLAQYAAEDAQLQQLAGSFAAYEEWSARVLPRWCDLFELFLGLDGRIPLATFFCLVPLIRPRYYSIASSAAVNPTELAICVSRLTYDAPDGRARHGFCSSFLTDRAVPGTRLRLKLVALPGFRLPFNLGVPVVMVAAGTGIAPFRGFWEERRLRLKQQQQLGPAVMLFGCRSPDSDYLMKEEIAAAKEAGALTAVLPAFSRQAGQAKTYVQDLIAGSAAVHLLKPLLQHPRVHVYVCGSSNMAADVSSAVSQLMGKEAIAACVQQGRYREDVYGLSISSYPATADAAWQQQALDDKPPQVVGVLDAEA